VKLDEQTALWSYLFEEMPVPCVETDASGIIFNANRAAATMLNTSVKHLGARLLMHFAEDRDRFGQLLRGLSLDGSRHSSSLVIRPRERAPMHVEATVMPGHPATVPRGCGSSCRPNSRTSGRAVMRRRPQTARSLPPTW
jgi:PAS domain-containing protein